MPRGNKHLPTLLPDVWLDAECLRWQCYVDTTNDHKNLLPRGNVVGDEIMALHRYPYTEATDVFPERVTAESMSLVATWQQTLVRGRTGVGLWYVNISKPVVWNKAEITLLPRGKGLG